jgi:hypothetical protein
MTVSRSDCRMCVIPAKEGIQAVFAGDGVVAAKAVWIPARAPLGRNDDEWKPWFRWDFTVSSVVSNISSWAKTRTLDLAPSSLGYRNRRPVRFHHPGTLYGV